MLASSSSMMRGILRGGGSSLLLVVWPRGRSLRTLSTRGFHALALTMPAYGASLSSLFRRSAWYVHRILQGAQTSTSRIADRTADEI